MRLIDVPRKTSGKVTPGEGRTIRWRSNDATAFATVTSVVAGSTLTYDVEIWKIE